MHIYALFDNATAELAIIKLLNVEVKETLDIYFQSFRSPKVKESARRGIECAYEILFSKDIKAYIQKAPISVTVKDFSQQVDGSSAGLAYSAAFAAVLKNEGIIRTSFDLPETIAATGEVDISGNVKEIKNLKEKISGAIGKNVQLMFYPSQNSEELRLLLEEDKAFGNAVKNSGMQLKHVASIRQLFLSMGILPDTFLQVEYSAFEYMKSGKNEDRFIYDLHNIEPMVGKTREFNTNNARVACPGKLNSSKKPNLVKILLFVLTIIITGILAYGTLEPSTAFMPVNLALKKIAYASSNENLVNSSVNAFDGNDCTRWSSEYSDQQWIYVDLGSIKSVSSVVLNWDSAYARQYQIQVSSDGFAWAVVYTKTDNTGGVNVINFDTVRTRYVKMHAWQRATPYGYSLREFEVYGIKQPVSKEDTG